MEYDNSVLEAGQIRRIGGEPCLVIYDGNGFRNIILTQPIRMGGISGQTLTQHPIIAMMPPAPRLAL